MNENLDLKCRKCQGCGNLIIHLQILDIRLYCKECHKRYESILNYDN